jgi:hypothetical protein
MIIVLVGVGLGVLSVYLAVVFTAAEKTLIAQKEKLAGDKKVANEKLKVSRSYVMKLDAVTHLGALPDAELSASGEVVKADLDNKKKERGLVKPEVRVTYQDIIGEVENGVFYFQRLCGMTEARKNSVGVEADGAKKMAADIKAGRQEQIDVLAKTQQDLQDKLAKQDERKRGLMAALTAEKTKLEDDKTKFEDASKKEQSQLKTQVGKLEQQRNKLLEQEVVVTFTIDAQGTLISADQMSGIAFISLGEHNRVLRGIKFMVFAMGTAGEKIWKGEVEVKEVYDTYSRVSIITQMSPKAPLIEGDYITNPFYSPAKEKTVVVVGDFPPSYGCSKDDMMRRITDCGAKVDLKVSPETTYLVIGDMTKQTEADDAAVKKAKELRIPIVPATDIMPYLGD